MSKLQLAISAILAGKRLKEVLTLGKTPASNLSTSDTFPLPAPLTDKPEHRRPTLTAYACSAVGLGAATGIFLMSWNSASEIGTTQTEVYVLRFVAFLVEAYSFQSLYVLSLLTTRKAAHLSASILLALVVAFTMIEVGTAITNIAAHYSEKVDKKLGLDTLSSQVTSLVLTKAKDQQSSLARSGSQISAQDAAQAKLHLADLQAKLLECKHLKGWKNITTCRDRVNGEKGKLTTLLGLYDQQEAAKQSATSTMDKTLGQLQTLQHAASHKKKHYFAFVEMFAETEKGRATLQKKLGILFILVLLALAFITPYLGHEILTVAVGKPLRGEELEPLPVAGTPASTLPDVNQALQEPEPVLEQATTEDSNGFEDSVAFPAETEWELNTPPVPERELTQFPTQESTHGLRRKITQEKWVHEGLETERELNGNWPKTSTHLQMASGTERELNRELNEKQETPSVGRYYEDPELTPKAGTERELSGTEQGEVLTENGKTTQRLFSDNEVQMRLREAFDAGVIGLDRSITLDDLRGVFNVRKATVATLRIQLIESGVLVVRGRSTWLNPVWVQSAM